MNETHTTKYCKGLCKILCGAKVPNFSRMGLTPLSAAGNRVKKPAVIVSFAIPPTFCSLRTVPMAACWLVQHKAAVINNGHTAFSPAAMDELVAASLIPKTCL